MLIYNSLLFKLPIVVIMNGKPYYRPISRISVQSFIKKYFPKKIFDISFFFRMELYFFYNSCRNIIKLNIQIFQFVILSMMNFKKPVTTLLCLYGSVPSSNHGNIVRVRKMDVIIVQGCILFMLLKITASSEGTITSVKIFFSVSISQSKK